MVHLCAHAYGEQTRTAVFMNSRGVSHVHPACFPVCPVALCRQAAAMHSTFVPTDGISNPGQGPQGFTWLRSPQHWALPSCRREASTTTCLTRHIVGGATGWTQHLSRRCPPAQPSMRSLCRPSTLCATPTYSTCWSPMGTTPCSQVVPLHHSQHTAQYLLANLHARCGACQLWCGAEVR